MKKGILGLMTVWVGMTLAQGKGPAQSPQAGASSSQPVRPLGVVTQLRPGSFTLHTDAGPEMLVQLPEAVTVVRVPPGAKDLKAATKIAVSDIGIGDRVLVRGRVSDDQKSVLATAVIVMAQADLSKAQEAERAEWRQRGAGGLVKAVNPETKEITISVANTPPTPGNPTRPVTISLAPNATLLRYAPDSVKFTDAKPSAFDEIKVGDQVRALGTKSEDGSRYVAERLVSGTFRNLGATVISVDAAGGAVTVKDLASGKPVVVRTNADSKLHRLPPFIAQMIAAFNSGNPPSGQMAARQGTGGPGGGPAGGAMPGRPPGGGSPAGAGGGPAGGPGGGPGRGLGGGPRDFQQMLERTPPLTLSELKPGEALIVVSTQGAKPSEVTAIIMLAGVEAILSARPKGSTEVVLGPWNMSMGGETGP
jgi:hypothetical protein